MNTISERSQKFVNTDYYRYPNFAEEVGAVQLYPQLERQYVLRCPIKIPGSRLLIPQDMLWCEPMIDSALRYQHDVVGIEHPFAYLTIRHGEVSSQTDDEWHVDGFSMKVPHIPEQNYVWVNTEPTECAAIGLNIPQDFDPLRHSVQFLAQDSIAQNSQVILETLEPEVIYAMDPYVIHRRPETTAGETRTFVRLSLTPIAIDDRNNATNPLFGEISSDRDGIADFRDMLARYNLAA